MALQLAYRAARISTTSSSGISFITQSTRALSLSSVLQASEWEVRGNQGNYADRKKAREELAAQRPAYKIRKGKKDITEYPDKHKPQSRQARFFDPKSSHGKKSLVYKFKTGQLSEELRTLQEKNGEFPDSISAFTTSKGEHVQENKYARKERSRYKNDVPADSDDISAMIRGEEPKARREDGKFSKQSRDFGDKSKGFGGGERDNKFGGFRDRASRPPRDNKFGGFKDRNSRPPRDNNFGGFKDRESRPPREGGFGGPRDRESRPPREGGFSGFKDRDSRPPREGGFNRDSRPPREGGFNRDSRPPREGGFNGFKDRESRPPREGGFKVHPPREGGFKRDTNFGDRPPRTFGDKPDFRSKNRDERPNSEPFNPRRNDPISIPYTTAASQFLYGKSVVEAALNAGRRKLYKLYIYHGPNRANVEENNQLRKLAERKGVEVITLHTEDDLRLLDKMAASRPHNGFILEASPLPEPPIKSLGPIPEAQEEYATLPGFPVELGYQSAEEAAINGTDIFFPAKSASHRPLVLVLDRILDPGNLGAILRTANFLGVTAVGMSKFGGAKLTPVALKASSGASETMNLFSIASLPEFLNSSRANGWVTYAAVSKEPSVHRQRRHVDLYDIERTDPLKKTPCILIMGSEGEGLDRLVIKKADYELSVPNMSGSGAVDSLNVGIAAGLLCTSFLKGMTQELNGVFETKKREVEEEEEVEKETMW
ncbi:putative rRNA methyltransferase mitochondrial precursor [Podospora fimiseda]|uniref:rRNA methyltransferase 1, mitochondrial n=1 Tax=Podospora fimiseda TaxID=252190 RepID=A0AAN7H1L5_9PEZI|nr:putative rRNA methyltransferase mitochondrial precursor [Podospora fimiseda]